MLEAESRGHNFPIVVHNNVPHKLLSTDSVVLAAITLNLDLHELLYLGIKVKNSNFITAAVWIPRAFSIDKVLERTHPGVDGRYDSIVQRCELYLDSSHFFNITRSSVIYVLEYQIARRAGVSISK